MNFARNYENLLNFVEVMHKLLVVPFFRTCCIYVCTRILIIHLQFFSGKLLLVTASVISWRCRQVSR